MRDINFTNGNYYHVYNRGVSKNTIFRNKSDYFRFVDSIINFNTTEPIISLYHHQFNKNILLRGSATQLVDVCAFCLCPNHFHLLLKQLSDDGVSRYLHKIGTGYTRYFNLSVGASGHIFQGKFKAKELKSSDDIFWLSAYINGNAEIHGLAKVADWSWSSYNNYLDKKKGVINNTEIMKFFRQEYPRDSYGKFVSRVISDSRKRKKELANLEE